MEFLNKLFGIKNKNVEVYQQYDSSKDYLFTFPSKRAKMDDGMYVCRNGDAMWFKNGERHREDGPAIECHDGTKEWWVNGRLHREDGAARELPDGSKEWWVNGKRHRVDRPDIENQQLRLLYEIAETLNNIEKKLKIGA